MKDALYHYRFILLALFNCSLMMTLGSAAWHHQFITAFIMLVAGLQFLSHRFWWTTLLSLIPFLFLYLPQFPRLTNHGNLLTLIGVLIISYALFKRFRRSTKDILLFNWPLLFRITLISIYFMAGFHKLNADFFNLNGSCSTSVNTTINQLLFGNDFVPSVFQIRFSQWSTIVMEMLIPFGLLHYKTRKVAAWLLVLFHFYLSLCNYANFSGLAGFLLAGSIIDYKFVKDWKPLLKALKVYLFFTIAACIAAYALSRLQLVIPKYIRFSNGLIFDIGWIYFFYTLLTNITYKKQSLAISPWHFAPVFFFLLWSGQAYVGLSTAGNLSMFSNLMTEKSRNNHWLINTHYTKLWDFEEDYVTIIELPEHLKWQNATTIVGYDLPLIEFKTQARRWVEQEKTEIACVIQYKGERIAIANLKESEFSKAPWWYHYIYYRKLPRDGKKECLW